ncbi:S8 family serine peptidase [Promineifilum sp.]|uniref:S8 family serine peptidase n=1 Tax=Promineifilum sp. TaxID=2664178 RepID=UPI0035B07933
MPSTPKAHSRPDFPTRRLLILLLAALTLFGHAAARAGDDPRIGARPALPTNQIIVQFNAAADPARLSTAAQARQGARLSAAAGVPLTFVRPMSGNAYVYRLPEAVSAARASALSRALADLPEVAYAEPDAIMRLVSRPSAPARSAAQTPNDAAFADQWHYRYTPGAEEGLNLPAAWDITTGSAGVIVAVIDTGIRPHADLAGRTVPGYDFISNSAVANDGSGRDADPSDPGDWITWGDNCGFPYPSSWHGTHVAGTIGAASNNGSGVAGVNWQARILPVRVLGKCGGSSSDIVDAIRWAAGLPVPGAPPNPNPARVINLSLGGSGSCPTSFQNAFNEAAAAGTVAIVAAGNESSNAGNYAPGNCAGVVNVAATSRAGNLAWYSNFGEAIDVSAPGGETDLNGADGVLSTLNDGETTPGNDILAYYQGTSMAAPHVAGLASLLLGQQPDLTPAEMSNILRTTARAFPAGSDCDMTWCGAGIADAYAALSGLDLGPAAPALVAPPDGYVSADGQPAFMWTAVAEAIGYDIQVAGNAAFNAPLAVAVNVAATTYTPTAPLADGAYWWRVRSVGAGDLAGGWSEVRTFTIDVAGACVAPAAITLFAPANGAVTGDLTPGFSWLADIHATQYEIRIDNNANMGSPEIADLTSSGYYAPGAALANGTYYWAVRGLRQIGECDEVGPWSVVRQVTIDDSLPPGYDLYFPLLVK